MLKTIISYFWGTPERELTVDELYADIEFEEDENLNACSNLNEPLDEYSCLPKTGTITAADGDSFTIDDKYKFKSDSLDFTVGSVVYFKMYVSNGITKISSVEVSDEWSSPKTDELGTWCKRTLPYRVLKREGRRVFLLPNEVSFDLNDVSIEFVPMPGDWVEVQAKVEVDKNVINLCGKVLEIEQVRPMGYYLSEGYIRRWSNETQEGVIDKSIFFKGEALMCGYIPFVGDKITVEVMESEQGELNKRAIKIVPQDLNNKVDFNSDHLPKFLLHSDKVTVQNNITIKSKRLGAKEKFQLPITNKSDTNLVILNVSYPTANCQCILLKPETLTDIAIQSGKSLVFEGLCVTKYVGVCKELILFTFSNFSIGCWITVEVTLNNQRRQPEVYKNSNVACAQFNFTNPIRGQRSTPTARFVGRVLHEYPVPVRLLEIVSRVEKTNAMQAVRDAKPCLTSKLQFNIYEDFFHTLLHLDEIYQLEAVKIYAQDYVCFIKNGEYLMLEIENLAERRPSLIVGDKIIAKNAYNSEAQEFEGCIHKTDAKHVYLKFSKVFHDEYSNEEMSVMAVISRTTYKRMHQAIHLAARDLRSAFLFPSKLVAKEPQVEITLDTNKNWRVQEKMLHSQGVILKWHNKSLNYYQKEAVRNILLGVARPLPYLIYGPPGTGKTVTLVETVLQILRFVPQSRIIVATPSNSAANLIALRLIDSKVLNPGDLVRLVGYHYVTENMLPPELVPYCATVDMAKEGTRGNGVLSESRLTIGYNLSVIGKHRIIVGTCSTLGSLYAVGVSRGQFTHIIVDEAGQATEPEIMVPLSLLDVTTGQVVLAGDPCQLGPVILSRLAADSGLTETFLDRLLTRFPYIRDVEGFPDTDGYDPRLITKLIYNYRSLPSILNMFNRLFYQGQLIPTISETDSKEANLLESLKEMLPLRSDSKTPAVVFHGVDGEDLQSADCPSWYNPDEASQIFFYVNELYRLGLKNTDIGIISPYIKQVRLICSLLMEAEFDMPKVGTVEDFQGHECNVILLTTVRSCEKQLKHDFQYRLGFLSHPKRLNVAISRAQVLLIVVGSPHLLGKDPHWRSVIKYCIENGAYCGCELPKI